MGNLKDTFVDDLFTTYKNTSRYKDDAMMEIMIQKKAFEKNLDSMWKIYQSGTVIQIANYNKQVKMIKDAGLKVFRNSAGKHKIVSR